MLTKTNMVIHNPHPVYLAFDRQLNLVPANSVAKQVQNPNELEQLLTEEILMNNDGFLHVESCPL